MSNTTRDSILITVGPKYYIGPKTNRVLLGLIYKELRFYSNFK